MYLVFSGNVYYPCGGWKDYKGSYSSLEEAVDAAKASTNSDSATWWQVVHDGNIVQEEKLIE